MSYTHSLVLVCPAEYVTTVAAVSEVLGHSPDEFSVPLSGDGTEPATHYGLHTWALPATAYAWTTAEEVPPLTPEQIAWLRSTLIMSARTDLTARAHFDAVLTANGLQVIEPDGLL